MPPPFGVHVSAAGGVCKAIERAEALGLDTLQVFTANPNTWHVKPPNPGRKAAFGSEQVLTKNSNQWVGKPFAPDEPAEFRKALRRTKLKFAASHDSYLINLATADPVLWRRSVDAFVDELDRVETLGLTYLVTHPGAHVGAGEEAGLLNVARAIDEVHARRPHDKVKVLLELTAGQGSCLGCRFERLAAVPDRVREPNRLGVCLDTCHV